VGAREGKKTCNNSTDDDKIRLKIPTIIIVAEGLNLFLFNKAAKLKPKGIKSNKFANKSVQLLCFVKRSMMNSRDRFSGKTKLKGKRVVNKISKMLTRRITPDPASSRINKFWSEKVFFISN
jgi:hypothetical protein